MTSTYNSPTMPARPEMPLITVGQAFSVLRARWRSVALVLGVALALGLAVQLLLPRHYRSTATVLLDLKSPDPISGLLMQGALATSYMNTQLDLFTSEAVARRVVRDLKLANDPDLRLDWRESTDGKGDFERWAAEYIGKYVDVVPGGNSKTSSAGDSNLLSVTYTATDPAFAARAANAYVKAYMDTMLDLRVAPARQYKQFFNASSQQQRDALETAQRKLSSYQQKHGLIGTDETLDVENSRLNTMMTQLVMLQAQATDSSSRLQQARSAPDATQEALASPLVGQLRTELQQLRSRLSERTTTLGKRHPQIVQLKAQIRELESRVAEETQRVSRGLGSASNIDRSRLGELQASVEKQRAKVMKMKAERDEAMVLQRDMENAQRAYDSVLGRASQMTLESQTGQTNALVVGQASEPSEPSSPKPLRTLAAAVLLGLLGGLLLALIREVRDPRIRTDDQAAALLQQPLVAVLPRFGGSRAGALPRLAAPAGRRARRLLDA